MWYDTLYEVLTIINNIILCLIGIPFFLQVVYMILFWVKKKVYPKSSIKHKAAIIIAARNEESVIYNTVKHIYEDQNYPKEKFDVYVVAHNCTDKTAELAEKAGAKVFVLNDPDKKRHIVCYALKYGINEIIKTGINYDFFIRFDADNHICPDFISLMNDCYSSGVELACPYESALNISQNNFTQACGLYYIFNSRFGGRVRERLGLSAHLNGPGMMFSSNIAKKYGYDCETICEDTEFSFKRLLDGYKAHYVEDAVVYEDLPSTMRDTYARNIRLGSGNIILLKKYSLKLLANLFRFRKGSLSSLEQILTFSFIPLCPILCIYLPVFYIYSALHLGLTGQYNALINMLILIGSILLFLFIFMGILQGFVLVLLDYKKMGVKKRRELTKGILLFPAFTVVYCVTITFGVFSKPRRIPIKRNPSAS